MNAPKFFINHCVKVQGEASFEAGPAGCSSYLLTGQSCVPGINTTDLQTVFEEQFFTRTLEDAIAIAGRLDVRVFSEADQIFHFGPVLVKERGVGSSQPASPSGAPPDAGVTENLRLTNPKAVPCKVQLSIKQNSDTGAGSSDAFQVFPQELVISPHDSKQIQVKFTPTHLASFGAVLEAVVPQGTDPNSNYLSFELRGDGAVPSVSLQGPRLFGDEGGELDMGKLALFRTGSNRAPFLEMQYRLTSWVLHVWCLSNEVQMGLRNDGLLPATVRVDFTPSQHFTVACPSSVSLNKGESRKFQVRFHPHAVGKVVSDLGIRTLGNPFEEMSADVPVGELVKVNFKLNNSSSKPLHFDFTSIPSWGEAQVEPSTGYVEPNRQQTITFSFRPADKLQAEKEKILCKVVNVDFLEEEEGAEAGERKHQEVEGTSQQLPLQVSVLADVAKLEPEIEEINFLPTAMFCSKVYRFTLKNPSLLSVPFDWRIQPDRAEAARQRLAAKTSGSSGRRTGPLVAMPPPKTVILGRPLGWIFWALTALNLVVALVLAQPLVPLAGSIAHAGANGLRGAFCARGSASAHQAGPFLGLAGHRGGRAAGELQRPGAYTVFDPRESRQCGGVGRKWEDPRSPMGTHEAQCSPPSAVEDFSIDFVIRVFTEAPGKSGQAFSIKPVATGADALGAGKLMSSYVVKPPSGIIPAESEKEIEVHFNPVEVENFDCTLLGSSPMIEGGKPVIRLPLTGSALRPWCHLEVPASEYRSRRQSDAPLDPKYHILEIISLGTDQGGTHVKNTKRFYVMNPTAEPLDFIWQPEVPMFGADASDDECFKCLTKRGTILPNKKFEMSFEFCPQSSQTKDESFWSFVLLGPKVEERFLVAGTVQEPRIGMDKPGSHPEGPMDWSVSVLCALNSFPEPRGSITETWLGRAEEGEAKPRQTARRSVSVVMVLRFGEPFSMDTEERVCDSCFDLLQHDKGRPVNEQFVEQKQIEASLKADLREKQQQEEWFRSFLAQVAAANGNAHARAVEELPQLIANGQRRWRETCQQLQKDGEELEQLQEKGNQLELQGRARASSLQELQRTVQHMQKDLKEGPALQSQCDELQRSTILLQQDLSGLQQRRAALEEATALGREQERRE
eukprot:g29084.t1